MRLVADRFVLDESSGLAIDLATGRRVTLTIGSAGGATEQARWSIRCDVLHRLHHPLVARLVDFGIVGPSSRFEAWDCGATYEGSADRARRVLTRASAFFRASGLTTGDPFVHASPRGALAVPGMGTGYSCEAVAQPLETLDVCGVVAIARPAVSALAEAIRVAVTPRPQIATLWGPPGSGRGTALLDVARAARLSGLVPIAASLIGTPVATLCAERSLLVLDDRPARDWARFLRTCTGAALPHALVVFATEEDRRLDGVALGPVDADVLIASVTPSVWAESFRPALRRAARQSRGWPGRFARALWPAWHIDGQPRPVREPARRVAEQAASYGSDSDSGEAIESAQAVVAVPAGWPTPGELGNLRRRMETAIVDIGRGRYAPGIRLLRQAVGGLARRGMWADAGAGAVVLAETLLARGRPRDTQLVLDAAREYVDRGSDDVRAIDVATLTGIAWIDLARLDEAESVLAAALAAARSHGDRSRAERVDYLLARCAFWRAEYGDAEVVLGPPPSEESAAVRHACLSARIALGLGDVRRAMALSTAVAERALAGGPESRALVASTQALVHLAVDDFDAVGRAATRAIDAARDTRNPLRALDARLLRAEADRRRGRSATALTQLIRLKRLAAAVPPILRSRWELMMAFVNGADPNETVRRLAAASGLKALALYAPRDCHAQAAGDPAVADVLSILQTCQNADDESVVLKDVCERVKHQLRAMSVAFVVRRGDRRETIGASGMRSATDLDAIAERVFDAGAPIAPHRGGERIEAGAPVLYGGAPIGALVARWPLGSTWNVSRAAGLLATAAAAAAPVVSAAQARQAAIVAGPLSELLGIAPAMAELRTGIERAAGAPFAVLVTGESGSGKELVARAIHRIGPRRAKAFCSLNCAALPDELIESELFGHARGSFTGAVGDRPGVFEEADGGTLFLDEVGELSPRAQAKLLRVIQEGELRRIGENAPRRVDVRIVSATNRDLPSEAAAGRFRIDLLYRLDVIHLAVPSLRDRPEDVALIAEHVWRDATARIGSRAVLSSAVLAALSGYNWPGNVRELQNVLASLAVRSPKRGVVAAAALPPVFGVRHQEDTWNFVNARRMFEANFVRAALVRSGGHRGRAADELGVSRQGLTKLMDRLGIGESETLKEQS